MDFSTMVDRQVTLSGVAYNALGSAVVSDPDGGWIVYVDGLDSWDDADYGKRVEVTGRMVRQAIAPQAEEKDGRHTHGAKGKALVIRDATWRFPG